MTTVPLGGRSDWEWARSSRRFIPPEYGPISLIRDKAPRLTRDDAFPGGGQRFDLDRVLKVFKARVDAGGLMLVQQDIYTNALTEFADMPLPAPP